MRLACVVQAKGTVPISYRKPKGNIDAHVGVY